MDPELIAKAHAAIAAGKNPQLVAARFRELYGTDLPSPAQAAGQIKPGGPTESGVGPGVTEGVARGLLKGATLNLGDDVMAGYAGLAAMLPGGRTPAQAVRETKDWENQRGDQFQKQHPKTAIASEIAGGILPSLLPMGAAVKAGSGAVKAGQGVIPALKGAARGGGSGALLGEVAGFGGAEGTVGERLRAGVPSALGGAAVGTVLGGALGAASPVANALKKRAAGRGERVAGALRNEAGITDDLLTAKDAAAKGIEDVRSTHYDPLTAQHQQIADPDLLNLLQSEDFAPAVGRVSPDGFAGSLPNLKQVQSVRKSVRGLLEKSVREGDTFMVDKYSTQLRDLNGAIRKGVDGLPEADRAYALAMENADALDLGRKMAGKSSADIKGALDTLDPANHKSFRTGMMHNFGTNMEKRLEGEGSVLKDLLDAGTETTRKTRTMFPDGPQGDAAYNRFLETINREKSAVKTAALGKAAAITGVGLGGVYQGWRLLK